MYNMQHNTVRPFLSRDSLPADFDKKHSPTLWASKWGDNKARSRRLTPAGSWEEIEAPSSAVWKAHNAVNNHSEFESRFFPSQASDETEAPADTLIAVLLDKDAEDPDKLFPDFWPTEIMK